jgi:glucokinase
MQIGLDLGGTKCLGVAIEVDPTQPLQIIAECRRSTPVGTEAILNTMVEVAVTLAMEAATELGTELGELEIALGAGVPGLITREGVMRASPNLPGMYEVNIAEELEARVRAAQPDLVLTQVIVDNDANCAAAAEWAYGAGRGRRDLLLVTLGTGIGGGLVIAGRPYRGHHGFAGEFGHMIVDPMGLECPCGQRGCWERYGSGSGLAHLAQAAGMTPSTQTGMELRSEDVVAAAKSGSALAMEVMATYSQWVAIGLVNLANILDPEMIIIGGGLASEAELFVPEVRRVFAELLYESAHRDHPVIAVAEADHRAGAIGAAVGAALAS